MTQIEKFEIEKEIKTPEESSQTNRKTFVSTRVFEAIYIYGHGPQKGLICVPSPIFVFM